MKTLKEFYNKNVNITATNNKRFVGKVVEYIYPEDNESTEESIIIDDTLSGNLVEFYAKDIEAIREN